MATANSLESKQESQTTFTRKTSPAGLSSIRRHNLSLVLRRIATDGSMSRATLSTATGLARATVSSLADELLAMKLVDEHGPSNLGRVGRPGSILAISLSGPCSIGLEIDLDHFEVCVLDLASRVRYREVRAHDNRGRPPLTVLRLAARLVRTAVASVATEGLEPIRLGVATPGISDPLSGTVTHAPNLGWEDIDLAQLLEAQLAPLTLPITVDNGANLAALAELHHGQGRQQGNFVLITGAIGIGAGIVINGELLRGMGGGAGELGHVPVSSRGPTCRCGGRGCLERFAGQEAILKAAHIAVPEGGPRHHNDKAVTLLVQRARCGDRATLSALATAGRYLGTGIGIIANILAPETIILAGIFAPLSEWLIQPLAASLERATAITRGPHLQVLVSQLGPDVATIGAATIGVIEMIDDPERAATPRHPANTS